VGAVDGLRVLPETFVSYVTWDDNAQSATEGDANLPVSSGTASKLIVATSANLGGGASITLTVRRNGADTTLGCTIIAGQNSCTDLVDSVTFTDGQFLSIRYNETGGPNVRVKYSILYRAP
jgi:hypothetical protein